MPDELLENIVQHTNQNLENLHKLFPFFSDDLYCVFVDVTVVKFYFCILYLRSSLKNSVPVTLGTMNQLKIHLQHLKIQDEFE